MILDGFCSGSYQSQSADFNVERCVNWYPEFSAVPSSKAPVALLPAPGVSRVLTFARFPNKALFAMDGRAFAVQGVKFYEFFKDLTTGVYSAVERGTVLADANLATICSNGDAGRQLFITAGNHGYCYDLDSNAFADVLTGATQGGYLNGRFLALDANTATLKSSAFADGTSWPGGLNAQRDTAADRWVAMSIIHGEIWLFGTQTTEVWYDAGLAPFPFAWVGTSGFTQHGCHSAFAVSRLERSNVILSQNEQGQLTVRQSNGYDLQEISTEPINHAMQGYDVTADAEAYSYQDQGHTFYVLSFPSATTPYGTGATWVYDLKTGLWHERPFYNSSTGYEEASRRRNHCFAFGAHLVADRVTGALYEQDITFATDADGLGLRRMRQSPYVNHEEQKVFFPGFTLDCRVGVGTASDPDPLISLQYSDSQGQVWSTEQTRSLGIAGAYQQRVRWFPLGQGRSGRVFRVLTTAMIPVALTAAYLQPDPILGAH